MYYLLLLLEIMLLRVIQVAVCIFHLRLWLHSIPVPGYITIRSPILLLMNIWVIWSFSQK